MPGIFDDEYRDPESIWPNPPIFLVTGGGTRPYWPLDVVPKRLKWSTHPRLSRLTSGQNGHAGTLTMILNRP